jgi:hypothetical protein
MEGVEECVEVTGHGETTGTNPELAKGVPSKYPGRNLN